MNRQNVWAMVDRFSGNGSMVFPEGPTVPAMYDIELWRESTFDGHPLRSKFTGRVRSKEDSLLAIRYIGKSFVLEMMENRRLSLIIIDDSGAIAHTPGPVEGFPGLKG